MATREVVKLGTNAAFEAAHDLFGVELPTDVVSVIHNHPPTKRAELARVIRRIGAQGAFNAELNVLRGAAAKGAQPETPPGS